MAYLFSIIIAMYRWELNKVELNWIELTIDGNYYFFQLSRPQQILW